MLLSFIKGYHIILKPVCYGHTVKLKRHLEIFPPFKERQRSIKIEGQQIAPPDDHQKRRLFAQASINHSEFSRSLDDSENLFMLPYYLKVRPKIQQTKIVVTKI
mgnify:CR=1 FL=1